ncbi:hypothetical protein A0J61_10200 [Choanephora cucurbitarum]|uniref:Choice-of-anchor A domain-containing protein n=2 Tax=Choanephora cucurbitarum TaxID=101091 RepID=A0A1C7MY93_9FUNG|nr:hypothetical protein A0J61_10200 [Choanephora cucurbitarum]
MVQKSFLFFVASAFLAGLQAASTEEAHINVDLNATTPVEKRHFLFNGNKCATGSYAYDLFNQFSGVFFGNFESSGKVDVSGGLAVKGDFNGHYASINSGFRAGFSYSSLESYGLIVGGRCKANSISVGGGSFIKGALSGGVKSLFDFFKLYHGSTGYYNFQQSQENAFKASLELSLLEPTLKLDAEGKLSSCGSADHGYHVLHFNTCGKAAFGSHLLSDAASILLGKGSWNGPVGMNWPSTGTIILNIPVDIGASFTVSTDDIHVGLDASRVIYNFYPANSEGKCHAGGNINLKREGSGFLAGFTLAPRAKIFDASIGAFAGTVIGHDFSCAGGIGIGSYLQAGGSHSSFKGCIPIHNDHTPVPSTTITVPPSATHTTIVPGDHHSTTTTTVPTRELPKTHTPPAATQTTAPPTNKHKTKTPGHEHGSDEDCGCGKHTTAGHNQTTTKGKHHVKTTTKGKHIKSTTKGKHHVKTTTKGKHHAKSTTKGKHSKTTTKGKHIKSTTKGKHSKTTHKGKHTPTVCPVGCATKTVTKVVYVTVN